MAKRWSPFRSKEKLKHQPDQQTYAASRAPRLGQKARKVGALEKWRIANRLQYPSEVAGYARFRMGGVL